MGQKELEFKCLSLEVGVGEGQEGDGNQKSHLDGCGAGGFWKSHLRGLGEAGVGRRRNSKA